MKVSQVLEVLDVLAPFCYTEKWDNCGLLVGDKDAEIDQVVLALDLTPQVLEDAISNREQLIITHHPTIFDPVKKISANSLVYSLIAHGIHLISAHSNLDLSPYGIQSALEKRLPLQNIVPLEVVYPSHNSTPAITLGCVGTLATPMNAMEFAKLVKSALNAGCVKVVNGQKTISRIAFCGGAGSDLIEAAQKANVDAYLTGEVKHNHLVEALQSGLVLMEAGHFATENVVLQPLCAELQQRLPQIHFRVSSASVDPVSYV